MSLDSVGLLGSIWASMESSDGHGHTMTCIMCFFQIVGLLYFFPI
jgi:hypothetical protein